MKPYRSKFTEGQSVDRIKEMFLNRVNELYYAATQVEELFADVAAVDSEWIEARYPEGMPSLDEIIQNLETWKKALKD